jgi:GAF domain-containing protein/CheY-like chemotaxis protein
VSPWLEGALALVLGLAGALVAGRALGRRAVARERDRHQQEAQRQAQRMSALADVHRLLMETLDPEVVGQRVADSIRTLLDARSSALYRIEPGSGDLVMVTVSGGDDRAFHWTRWLARGTGVAGIAVGERRPVASPDVLAGDDIRYQPAVRAGIEAATHRALLAVPLQARDRLFGALAVGDRTGRVFAGEEVRLAQAFADSAALALENARLFAEGDRRLREAEVLADLARRIGASLDVGTVLRSVAEGARELCASDMARMAVREPGADSLVVRYVVGSPARPAEDLVIEPGKGSGGQVLATGRPFRTDSYADDPRISHDYLAVAVAEQVTAQLVVPIRGEDRIEGLLYVARRAPQPYTDHDEAVLTRLADHAAVAVENARLYREARLYADRLRSLEEVNRLISSSLQMDEVLRNIAAAVSRFLDASLVSVWVLDGTRGVLRRELALGDAEALATFPAEVRLEEAGIGWSVAHREPILWADAEHDPRAAVNVRLLERGLRFFTAYPIALGDRVLGVFAVNRAAPLPATPETASMLGSLAAQAALALDHARLYQELTRHLEETRALLEVAELLNSTLELRALLERVAIKVAQVCRVDRCAIFQWDGARVVPLMAQFADGRQDARLWAAFRALEADPPEAVPAHVTAIRTRQPVIIDDATASAELPGPTVATFGIRSYLAVPLIRQDQVVGLMSLDTTGHAIRFDPAQVDLAMAIAGQLALALANTRLYAEAQERVQETTTLLAVGRVLSEPAPAAEMMRRVAREVARAVGADTVAAYVREGRSGALVPLAGYHVPPHLTEAFGRRSIDPARLLASVPAWREGHAAWSADVLGDPRFSRTWVEGLPALSALVAPAMARGEPVGALLLAWWRVGREFPPALVRLIEGVAAQMGLALENADLARQTASKLRETETLLSVSRALSSTLDLQALLRHLLRRVARAVDADTVGTWLAGPDGEWMEPAAGYRVPAERMEALRGLRLSLKEDPFYAEAARTRRPVLSQEASEDPRIPERVRRAVGPHRTNLFVPIVASERVIGGFAAVWWTRRPELSGSDLALLEAIGSQAGIAIENARLFQENRRQVEELSLLHDLSRAVTGELDQAALLDTLHRQVLRVLEVRHLALLLHDEPSGDFQAVLRLRDGIREEETRRYPAGIGLMSVVLRERRPVRTTAYGAECARRGVPPVPGMTDLKHWLGVPLRAGETVLGVLALSRDEPAFTDADERLLGGVGDLMALALRSARLYEDRTRAYRELTAAQDQLVRTEKLRALGEMASGVAHDFNNLLAAILGRAQLALRRVADPKIHQWLEIIERSALDGARTVRRLQEFTRIRRDQPLIAVDLNRVVRDALEITRSRWREEPRSRGIAIEVHTPLASLPPVSGDPAELREALTNLILNAVDAMPHGGTLTLSTAAADDTVELTVGDTGVGIPAAVRDRIFDPFFTTKGSRGTGLGLSMTYGILTRHGARIVLESEEGHGSTFRLTFPRAAEAMLAPAAAPEPPSPVAALRCLVVDDEPSVGAVLGDILTSSGHSVTVVTSGAEAIERFRQEPYELVFTDLAMPIVSGWQVARAVKALAPDVPVYLVTGFGVELSDEQRQANAVDAVIVKPLKMQDVLEAAAQAGRRRAHAGTAGSLPRSGPAVTGEASQEAAHELPAPDS